MELWIFLAAIYVVYFLFFKKKKHKSAGSPVSRTVKAPPKATEWSADTKKKEMVVQKDDSEDDNLATFTLSSGQGVELRVTTNHYRNTSKSAGVFSRWVYKLRLRILFPVCVSVSAVVRGSL